MRPATVATLVLLLVTSVTIPVGSTALSPAGVESTLEQFDEPSPVISPVDNFANYASIPAGNVTTSAYGSATVDVGTTIASDTASLHGDYRSTEFENRFYNTQRSAERDEIIAENVRQAEERTQELRDRRADTITAYSSNAIPSDAFVRKMALIDSEARQVSVTLDRIKEVTRDSGYSLPRSLDTKIENLRGELEVLRGPVAQHANRAVAGGDTIEAIYVESSESGYTLAMIDGDSYYRETYLAGERQPDATDQFRESDLYLVNAANRRGIELYPWVTNDTSPSGQALGETGIYRFRAEYTRGDLTAYLDGGTTNVFREFQRQAVTAVPVSDVATARSDSLRVQVNLTYETGPMDVTVIDNETGESVDGTVTVTDTRVGRTGDDGRIWLVEPRPGVPLTIQTDGGDTVTVRIPP